MAEPLLQINELETHFFTPEGVVKAVNGVTYDVQAGETLGLVGESGSGKSTTANIILRLLSPTSGRIFLKGRDISEIQTKDYYKQVQVVFQDPYGSFNLFYPIDRVLNQAFNLVDEKYSSTERKEIIRDTLSKIGMNADEVLGRFPHQLSGGQLQRFLIARCLIIKPQLLVADEPTSMIDASSRAGILNLLLDLKEKEGLSILFITHDIAQAQYLSDKVMVMQKGQIVEQGLAEEVFGNPQHPYTRALLDSVPSLKKTWDF